MADTKKTEEPPLGKAAIRRWWAENPMTYGDAHGQTSYAGGRDHVELGSPEFFASVDDVFYRWNEPLHTAAAPFGRIFPYEELAGRPVLEVGCGMGTMAMNWCRRGARLTAVDLNPVAVRQTTRRLRLSGLEARVAEADGNALPFPDGAFDFVYSWGVLHHSPRLDRSLAELARVLRPGGSLGVMLYSRRSLMYGYYVRYLEGVLHGESIFLGAVELASRYSDASSAEGNPHTWPITPSEGRRALRRLGIDAQSCIFGTDLEWVLARMIPIPRIQALLPRTLKKVWARRLGWSLWLRGTKREKAS